MTDAEIREQIEVIVTAEYRAPRAEPAVMRIERIMQLIHRYGLEQRLDEHRLVKDKWATRGTGDIKWNAWSAKRQVELQQLIEKGEEK